MKKQKAIIHIGGSYLQLPSVRWAGELGLHVVLTDKNPECPGRRLADQFEQIGGTDIPSLLDLAYRTARERELVGAYASSDFGLGAVAAIAEALDRPGCSRSAMEHALDKSASKDIWLRAKLPIPGGVIVRDRDGLTSAVEALGLPLIIKPASSSGSQGVRSVWQPGDLEEAYAGALRFSDAVIVEEIVRGHHVDVNGLFVGDAFFPCGVMDRLFSAPPFHYPLWGCQPSSLNSGQERDVYALVERAARALGVSSGPVKADVVWTDGGPVILELTPRFHGDVSTAHVTPLATGGSPIKSWMGFLAKDASWSRYLGQGRAGHAGWMALFPSMDADLEAVVGVEEARSVGGVEDVFVRVKPGDHIKKHVDNSTLCGFIWAVGEDREDVYRKLAEASACIRFVSRSGKQHQG